MVNLDEIVIPTNKYQTPITRGLLESMNEDTRERFLEDVTTIPFIKNLISPDRPYYKDLPRDENGRAIVDITNPPILEDADFFRKPALHFKEHGCYTFLRPSSNPNSAYYQFWEEEKKKCWYGVVRESDGAWITGINYWFLNYQPMMVNIPTGHGRKALRIESFPFLYEGDVWRNYYLYFARETGHHAIELAKRGAAKSYTLASIMERNLILGENEEACRRQIVVLAAALKEYLADDRDGTLSKFKPAINFAFANLPFPHLMLKNSPNEMSWQMGYKDRNGIERGTLNQVMAVSAKDDSEKLRGKRGWILLEEMGNFANLLTLYDVTRKSVEDGDNVFATMYLVGTSNNKESDFSSAKTLLYNPEAYNLLANNNVYDRPKDGRPTFGYFYPSYLNRAGCCNEDGVSDVVKALLQVYKAREDAKKSSDPRSLLRVIGEDPITPAEAMVKVKDAFFPITALNERLQQLDSDPKTFSDVYTGSLALDAKTGKVKFVANNDVPIRKWKTSNDTKGAVEIFEMPQKNREGEVFPNRYIVGLDPVDNDQAESSSFSSTFVFDLFTDKIVAEYTGRQSFADENFEITRLLCLFYNAKCLPESNKKGWFAYFQKMGSTYLLATTPQHLREKQLVKYSSFGSNAYGVNANAAINNYANGLIRDWLLKPAQVIVKEGDTEVVQTMPQLYFIRNRALLEELIGFNPFDNFDRIRALGMVMLLREEMMVMYGGDLSEEVMNSKKSSLANDDFFERNYNRTKSI